MKIVQQGLYIHGMVGNKVSFEKLMPLAFSLLTIKEIALGMNNEVLSCDTKYTLHY